ncbi:MAG: M28 family peptidase [Leptospiraceae bacterium]|nr:M28 family peptidase [Leptospiraceae bacterium]MDW7975401.1 M28 family peptidase [Leptospiraceae bacterium]
MRDIKKSIIILFVFVYGILVIFTLVSDQQFRYFTTKEISLNDMQMYLRLFSDDSKKGRYPGSKEMADLQTWLVSKYQALAIYPIFDGKYTMEFSFPGRYQKVQNSYIKIKGCDDCVLEVEPMPLGANGSYEGKIIYGDYCIEENFDLSRAIREKNITKTNEYIVICKRYAPEEVKQKFSNEAQKLMSFEHKYSNIQRLGFKGVIFLKEEGDPFRLEHAFFTKKGSAFSVFLDEKKYSEMMRKITTHSEIEVSVRFDKETLLGKNIAASLKPLQENQKIIIIGAHYDHLGFGVPQFSMGPMNEIYNGADDNASGNVAVLELAEYFSKEYEENPKIIPEDWNLVFIHFDGEEWGLIGSDKFVNSNYLPKKTVAMFNFDMVGRYRDSLQIQGKDTGDTIWQNWLEKTIENFTQKNPLKVVYLKGGIGPSDHTSFYKKNISILYFFTGIHEDYHKPTDDFQKINYEKMGLIVNLAKELILNLVNLETTPTFQKAKDESDTRRHQYRVRLGIIPKNYFNGEGIEVGGFVEGAPIQKSGIKEGDIIIQIEDKKLQSIYDLMEFLSQAELKKKYKIYYKRNGVVYQTYAELMGKD